MKQQRNWQRNVGQRNEVIPLTIIPLPRPGPISRSHDYSGGNWSTHNYYHADGNGNVTYLVDGSQGLAASYRYDAYGNLFGSSGSLANDNVYRFSSKAYLDSGNTGDGLYYYGYRFYAPNLQRWLNRDPLGEFPDGPNLYAFVRNRAVNFIDIDGRSLWGTPFIPKPLPEDIETCGKRIADEVDNKGKPKDDVTSSYLHCVVSCRVSRECGPLGKLAVWIAGDWLNDPISQDHRNPDGPYDRHANQVGRDFSCKRNKSCEELCGDAYRNGDLKYNPPAPTVPKLPPLGF